MSGYKGINIECLTDRQDHGEAIMSISSWDS